MTELLRSLRTSMQKGTGYRDILDIEETKTLTENKDNTSLASDEENDFNSTTSASPSRTFGKVCGWITIVITIVLMAATIFFFAVRTSDPREAKRGCGSTPEEARARGCHFELTGSSWVHPDCYDPQTETDFLNFKERRYWADINYTREVPIEEVRKGEGPGWFVTSDYHKNHCGYLLLKVHRAVEAGRPLDGLIKSLGHTSHCVRWMLDPPKERWDKPQFAYTKYPYCGSTGGYGTDEKHPFTWVD